MGSARLAGRPNADDRNKEAFMDSMKILKKSALVLLSDPTPLVLLPVMILLGLLYCL